MSFCWKRIGGNEDSKRLMGASLASLLVHAFVIFFVVAQRFWGGQSGLHASVLSVVLVHAPQRVGIVVGDAVQVNPSGFREKTESGEKESHASESKPAPIEMEYYPGDALTRRPYPITVLEVPEVEGGGQGVVLEGRAVIKVWISSEGSVEKTERVFSDMPAVVYEATVAAYQLMRFAPAEIDGRAVGCVVTVEISYDDFRLGVDG